MNEALHPNDYERSDADPRLVGAIAAGLAVFLICIPFLLLTLYPDVSRLGRIANLPAPRAPRLQTDPKRDLDRLRAQEDSRLGSTGWVDRERQIAHIPIDRAIELLAQRGLAGWPSPPSAPAQR